MTEKFKKIDWSKPIEYSKDCLNEGFNVEFIGTDAAESKFYLKVSPKDGMIPQESQFLNDMANCIVECTAYGFSIPFNPELVPIFRNKKQHLGYLIIFNTFTAVPHGTFYYDYRIVEVFKIKDGIIMIIFIKKISAESMSEEVGSFVYTNYDEAIAFAELEVSASLEYLDKKLITIMSSRKQRNAKHI